MSLSWLPRTTKDHAMSPAGVAFSWIGGTLLRSPSSTALCVTIQIRRVLVPWIMRYTI